MVTLDQLGQCRIGSSYGVSASGAEVLISEFDSDERGLYIRGYCRFARKVSALGMVGTIVEVRLNDIFAVLP
jgi:hypothetical protein